jgi:endonuclease/exonuclease/phosphatase family metal-dependent hydrolase
MNDPTLTSYLVDIARKFDVLAIQELRSTDDTIIPRFVQMINQTGVQYGYDVGPREGHTTSKEQYVFIFNEQKIERVDQGMVLRHPQRLLHRDPLAVTFRCRTPNPQNGFSFTLINIHTDPDVVASELDALADILQMARQAFRYEDDLILLGDLNAAPNQFGRLGQVANLFAAIPPQMPTNAARTKCYDNIVFDRYATSEFQNKSGAFDLAQHYNLTIDQAKSISDHQPVWGLFSAYEKPQAGVATQPLGLR